MIVPGITQSVRFTATYGGATYTAIIRMDLAQATGLWRSHMRDMLDTVAHQGSIVRADEMLASMRKLGSDCIAFYRTDGSESDAAEMAL